MVHVAEPLARAIQSANSRQSPFKGRGTLIDREYTPWPINVLSDTITRGIGIEYEGYRMIWDEKDWFIKYSKKGDAPIPSEITQFVREVHRAAESRKDVKEFLTNSPSFPKLEALG